MSAFKKKVMELHEAINSQDEKLGRLRWQLLCLKDELLVTNCKNKQLFEKVVDDMLEEFR